MTPLSKPVRRAVQAYRRGLIVTLEMVGPDPVIGVREKGRRKGYTVTVEGLFLILAKRAADIEVANRKAKRKSRA